MIRVKICGVNSAAAFDAAAEAGADWIGFVFFAASPRHVTPAEAAALSARHGAGPSRVGLFVEPNNAAMAAALDALPLQALQVYTTPERAAEIAALFAVPVWRAIPVAARADLPSRLGAEAAFVIEPRPPGAATRPGGNATTLDHTLLQGWSPVFPWLLAGGLTPGNVAAAIRATGAPAVDVSSGVESSPGQKDPALIRAFLHAVNMATTGQT